MHNKAILDIVNKGNDTMIFETEEIIGIIDLKSLGYYKIKQVIIGIIDLKSLGYYKIKQVILQQNLSRYYRFEKAEKLCKYFNNFVNTLKKEREQNTPKDNYPWLDPDDIETLEKYINLSDS